MVSISWVFHGFEKWLKNARVLKKFSELGTRHRGCRSIVWACHTSESCGSLRVVPEPWKIAVGDRKLEKDSWRSKAAHCLPPPTRQHNGNLFPASCQGGLSRSSKVFLPLQVHWICERGRTMVEMIPNSHAEYSFADHLNYFAVGYHTTGMTRLTWSRR